MGRWGGVRLPLRAPRAAPQWAREHQLQRLPLPLRRARTLSMSVPP